MKKINEKEFAAVLSLPGIERFKHFIKTVVDWEEVWCLFSDGWALMANDDGTAVFPLWPAKAYAEAFVVGEWQDYEPTPIALREFTDVLLPKLDRDGILLGSL